MPLQPGDLIGPYQIQEQLGTGGMATVYKAHHPRLDRYVAVKVMHPQFLEDENFHARFEREARVVARLEHPNIVPIYDFSDHERQPYLIMKYVDGRTLKQIVRKGAVSLDEILRIMNVIAGALDYAHQQGVLHRDVKPSNIIIDENGTPYITDFGLARIMQSGESTMSADMMLGTPQYISPEQARGDANIDHRTDLYSFAIVLYELLVGRVPFSADTPYATVHEQIYNPPPPPSSVNPEITPPVEAVLLKALSKEPTERYPSAKALMQALKDALTASNLNELDPSRISKAVPVQHTPSPIPPAVKQTGAQSRPPQPPPSIEEIGEQIGRIGEQFGEMMGQWGENFGRRMEERFDPASRSQSRQERRNHRRGNNPSRMSWSPGAEWRLDGPEGAGFYTKQELEAFKLAAEASMSDEERVRKFVEKKFEERAGFMIHFAIYLFVNLMIIGGSLSDGDFSFGAFIPAFFWGIGIVAHFMDYNSKYGAGRDRREAMVEAELERERSRILGRKAKNDDLFDEAADRIRLTEDGELSDSFVDELEEKKRKRQG
jgi:serine/threonine protein kinase